MPERFDVEVAFSRWWPAAAAAIPRRSSCGTRSSGPAGTSQAAAAGILGIRSGLTPPGVAPTRTGEASARPDQAFGRLPWLAFFFRRARRLQSTLAITISSAFLLDGLLCHRLTLGNRRQIAGMVANQSNLPTVFGRVTATQRTGSDSSTVRSTPGSADVGEVVRLHGEVGAVATPSRPAVPASAATATTTLTTSAVSAM